MLTEKITVNYLSIEQLEEKYINGSLEYSDLGVMLSRPFAICLFLYPRSVKKRNHLDITSTSYTIKRKGVVNYLIEHIIKDKQLGRKSTTSYRKAKELKYFIEYVDTNHFDITNNIKFTQTTYLHYTKYLQDKITNGTYEQRTASRLQKEALSVLSSLHGDKTRDIVQGTAYIHSGNENRTTVPKNVNDMKYSFKFYYDLFTNLHDFTIKNRHYPHKVSICDKDYWLFPYNKSFIATKQKKRTTAFDFNMERVLTYEDFNKQKFTSITQSKKDGIKRAIRLFNALLNKTNHNYHCEQRKHLARYCADAYYMLFLFTTGMNDSTAGTLLWNQDYTIEKEIHNFKNIKYRANNKTVKFSIASKFVKLFKKYLEIRNYLLNGHESKYLFFDGYESNNHLSTSKIAGNMSSKINASVLKTLEDKKIKGLSSRTIRLYKSKYLIEKNGILEASNVLQTNISTLIKHYTGEDEESSSRQMTNFFNDLNKNVFSETEQKTQKIPIGQCIEYGKPNANIELKAIDIDCKRSEGCLFCDKFRCHADEEDVRKLFSILFLIEETKKKASSIEHFNSIYLIIIERINNLAEELSQKLPSVYEIKKDVFENENLTYYWERKLEILIDLKVL